MSNNEPLDFADKCAYVSASKHLNQMMIELADIADEELWELLDMCACKIKEKLSREALNDD